MANFFVLDLEPNVEQDLTINGVQYTLNFNFNTRHGLWFASINRNGLSLVNSLPVVNGVDILAPYNLPFKFLFARDLKDTNVDPSLAENETSKIITFQRF